MKNQEIICSVDNQGFKYIGFNIPKHKKWCRNQSKGSTIKNKWLRNEDGTKKYGNLNDLLFFLGKTHRKSMWEPILYANKAVREYCNISII